MKYKIKGSGATVELGKDQFIAKGGEGSIYIIGDTVYKVCDDGKMIAEGKFKELAVLDHLRIVKPEDVILHGTKPVGYTMKAVPGTPITLAQMLTKTYREREGVTPDMMRDLVEQIVDGIRSIHKRPGYLQVDGNQLNYMVTNGHKDLYFIDVNSYQTPNFPADAIMPNIRDWNVGTNFTQLTDWYSFAIISFYMFTGIHPFMHSHPRFPSRKTAMIDQMKAGCSILDPESQFPMAAVYYPFTDFIPANYFDWYKRVFVDNQRLPPPGRAHSTVGVVFIPKQLAGTNFFDIMPLRTFMGNITGYLENKGREIVLTTDGICVDNQNRPKIDQRFRVGFTPTNNTPVAMVFDSGIAKIKNLDTGEWLPNNANPVEIGATDIMGCEGRLYVHSGQHLYEIAFVEGGGNIIGAAKHIASVMPHATKLYQGVALQDMMGSTIASIFPEAGHHRQVRLAEIEPGMRVVDAKYERNVLMMVVIDNETGQHTRFVFRFAPHFVSYDVRKVEDITPVGLNFTVLDNGICVCITEEDKVEIFTNKANDPNVKSISDPAVNGNMHLCHSGTQVRLAHGDKIYSFVMKKSVK